MLLSTRARLISGILILFAIVFTAISLFTCHWVDHRLRAVHTYNGLFDQKDCAAYPGGSPAWNTATLAMMIIALAAQVILVIFVGISTFLPRVRNSLLMKADIVLITIAFLTLLACLITFGVSSMPYWKRNDTYSIFKYTFGYSFWLVIPAAVFTLVALGPLFHSLHSIHRGRGDGDWRF